MRPLLRLPVHAGVSDDLDLLLEALEPSPGKRFLALSAHGAGEAALCLAAAGADRVLLHDIGDADALEHLVHAKLTAARLFGREDYLALMGLRPVSDLRRRALVDQLLRGLTESERPYWKRRRAHLMRGLFRADKVGAFFDVMLRAFSLLGSKTLQERIVFGETKEERVEAFRAAVGKPWVERALSALGGRLNLFFPRAEWEASAYPRALNRQPLLYLERLVAAGLGTNPLFAHHFYDGRPVPEALLPPHLRPGLFDGLRSAGARVRVVRVLREQPGGFSGAYTSNVIDYLMPAARRSLFAELLPRLEPGAPVLIYSNEEWSKVPEDERFGIDEEASTALAEKDRARIYRRVALYRMAGTSAMDVPRSTRLRVVR